MSKYIQIIDVGIGNIASISNMLNKLGAKPVTISDPRNISSEDKIILPGVGAYDAGIIALEKHDMKEALKEVAGTGTIIMGICLGMQLLFSNSEEGVLSGLGLLDGKVVKFNLHDTDLKIPHMGWKITTPKKNSLLFPSSDKEYRYYFVHSYHCLCENENDILATTFYGYDFATAVQMNNIFGVQFHPEKSHRFGMELLKNFVEIK